MSPRQKILSEVRKLEAKANLVDELRDACKSDAGRLSDDGKAFVQFARLNNFKQAWVAKVLDVTPSAICHHYNK